jgi:hypothetical protein
LLDRSGNRNLIRSYNGLSDHDALILALCKQSYNFLKSGFVRIGSYYDHPSVREFKLNLSYEDQEKVLNTYLRVLYTNFPLHTSLVKDTSKERLNKGMLTSSRHKNIPVFAL